MSIKTILAARKKNVTVSRKHFLGNRKHFSPWNPIPVFIIRVGEKAYTSASFQDKAND